ncbi:MAG TPA: helix-turn-helix domain-containing protein, partial [Vicinamibacterales bacterium]|nr:helix-turn-helix domain-containing protein [Vicinamibacterales bacterium]
AWRLDDRLKPMMPRPDGRMPAPRVTVTRHVSDLGRWELAKAAPAESLRPFAREYVGWSEEVPAPLCRRELPTEEAPLVINFGGAFRLFAPGESRRAVALGSFITGAYDTYQLVESAGATSGVQVNFTLLGIRLLVGRPIEDMTNGAFAPEDIFGTFARQLTERLYEGRSWEARFDWLDRALTDRLRNSREVPAAVRCAWQRLIASSGRASISSIVREVGWSQRHFIARFRHEIGVSPKVFARMLRFGRVVRDLRAGRAGDLADISLESGYCDQSHLNRDAREFAGVTPGELRKSLLPDGGGFSSTIA